MHKVHLKHKSLLQLGHNTKCAFEWSEMWPKMHIDFIVYEYDIKSNLIKEIFNFLNI